MAETPLVVRVLLGGLCAVIGAAVIYVGVVRPPGLWGAAKIQNTVRAIGDGGMSAIFIGLGVLSLAGAALIFVRR